LPVNAQVSFAPVRSFPTGDDPKDVVAADFDEDGNVDLAVASACSLDISLHLGDGSGGFGPARRFAGGGALWGLVARDFDRDGHVDLAAADATHGRVVVRLGDGARSFSPPRAFAVGTEPRSLAVGDFDEDGNLDLAVANRLSNDVSVLLGDGAGDFAPAPTLSTSTDPRPAVASDFDGDGHVDLAVPNYGTDDVSVFFGDGTGSFPRTGLFATGAEPSAIAAGDLNEDGAPDLVTANTEGDDVSVLIGDGAGSFAPPRSFAAGDYSHSVELVDLDEDGHLDAVTTNFRTDDASVLIGDGRGGFASVLIGDGRGGFASAQHFGIGIDPRAGTYADLDGDGHQDLIGVDTTVDLVSVLLNRTFEGDEYLCRAGDVNGAAGPVENVLFVNGLAGTGASRHLTVDRNASFTLRVDAPSSKPTGPSPFALYVWIGEPTAATVTPLPFGYGTMCMDPELTGGHPRRTWNNTGDPAFGAADLPSSPAPSVVLQRQRGLRRSITVFLQGVLEDAGSPSGSYAVTNGIVVESR
jgi:hypothetical protein